MAAAHVDRIICEYAIHAHKMGLTIPAIQADCQKYQNGSLNDAQLYKLLKSNVQMPRLNYPLGGQVEKRFHHFLLETPHSFDKIIRRGQERGFLLTADEARKVTQRTSSYRQSLETLVFKKAKEGVWDLATFIQKVEGSGYTKREILFRYLKRLPQQFIKPDEWEVAMQGLKPDKWMEEIAHRYIIHAHKLGMPIEEIWFEVVCHGYNVLDDTYVRIFLQLYTEGKVEV